ncbi:MAG: trypsin-like peptidase domain-containing protein [Myxococcota bacterium]|jgi:serine protease Do|nr:trypsin-like peptidase domain-containing protein [Myxococcota bacterium]
MTRLQWLCVAFCCFWSALCSAEQPLWTEAAELDAPDQVLRSDTFVELSRRVSPAVVNILAFESGESLLSGRGQRGGSGFFINEQGFLLTNAHVVDGCDVIVVSTDDGEDHEATLVATDPPTDLALLKVERSSSVYVRLADSDAVEVGEWVMAIGSPLGLDHTVTVGVISAKGRENPESYADFLQTDASINPGNSGGPLFNLQGDVIAINTAINPFGQGISFAVPINVAKALLPMLAEGKVVRSWIGVMVQSVPKELGKRLGLAANHGAVVASVLRHGPADLAGLEAGDVITHFDSEEVNERSLRWKASMGGVGRVVSVKLLREGEPMSFELTLQELDTTDEPVPSPQIEETTLGMKVLELTAELAFQLGASVQQGLMVLELDPGGEAALAGMQLGDVISQVQGETVLTVEALQRVLSGSRSGDILSIRLTRGESELLVSVGIP